MTSTRARPVLGLVTLATLALYPLIFRPRHLRWGATDEEVASAVPGDDQFRDESEDAARDQRPIRERINPGQYARDQMRLLQSHLKPIQKSGVHLIATVGYVAHSVDGGAAMKIAERTGQWIEMEKVIDSDDEIAIRTPNGIWAGWNTPFFLKEEDVATFLRSLGWEITLPQPVNQAR